MSNTFINRFGFNLLVFGGVALAAILAISVCWTIGYFVVLALVTMSVLSTIVLAIVLLVGISALVAWLYDGEDTTKFDEEWGG